MEGNGPTGGETKFAGLTFAGLNPFALDAVAGEVIGIPVSENPLILAAAQRRLWSGDVSSVTVLGEKGSVCLQDFFCRFARPDSVDGMKFSGFRFVPDPVKNFLKKNCTPYPFVMAEQCVGCGECAASCPQKIIRIVDKKAKINPKDGCISCFCCQEMCPREAIRAKKEAFHPLLATNICEVRRGISGRRDHTEGKGERKNQPDPGYSRDKGRRISSAVFGHAGDFSF